MKARRWMCTAALTVASAHCGVLTTVSVQRHDPRITVVTDRRVGSLRASVTREGTVARVRVARAQLCQSHNVLQGVEEITTTRSAAQPATVSLLTTSGWLTAATGLGVMLYPAFARTPDDGSGLRSWNTSLPLGGGIIGLGALMLIPWIYTGIASGSSTASRDFREDQPPQSPPQPCGDTPERAVIAFEVSGARTEHTTGNDGVVSVDLAASLPPEALQGAAPLPTLAVTSREGHRIGLIELAPFRQALADAQWTAASQSRSDPDLDRFALAFPDDARAESARVIAAQIRRSRSALARDAERGELWRAAGDDPERLRALVAEQLGDIWEAEAVCRLEARLDADPSLQDARARCAQRLSGVDIEARSRHPELVHAAERSRDELERRIAEAERREAEAQSRADEARARAARRAAAAERDAAARVRSVLTDCRAGRATGAAPARLAFQALTLLRSHNASGVERMVIQVAAACRCTPSCAGVSAP